MIAQTNPYNVELLMSNWLDVRIKLYSDKSQVASIGKKFKDYFHKSTRKDPCAAIYLGSEESKFVWCAIKSFDNFNSVMCYTKCGFDEVCAGDVCAWIGAKFEDIKDIDIQIRDDGSKVFAIYHWSRSSKDSLRCRRIDPMLYPNMSADMLDSYTEAASKRISAALKNSGIVNVVSVGARRSRKDAELESQPTI